MAIDFYIFSITNVTLYDLNFDRGTGAAYTNHIPYTWPLPAIIHISAVIIFSQVFHA
jgi:hypothetical protein